MPVTVWLAVSTLAAVVEAALSSEAPARSPASDRLVREGPFGPSSGGAGAGVGARDLDLQGRDDAGRRLLVHVGPGDPLGLLGELLLGGAGGLLRVVLDPGGGLGAGGVEPFLVLAGPALYGVDDPRFDDVELRSRLLAAPLQPGHGVLADLSEGPSGPSHGLVELGLQGGRVRSDGAGGLGRVGVELRGGFVRVGPELPGDLAGGAVELLSCVVPEPRGDLGAPLFRRLCAPCRGGAHLGGGLRQVRARRLGGLVARRADLRGVLGAGVGDGLPSLVDLVPGAARRFAVPAREPRRLCVSCPLDRRGVLFDGARDALVRALDAALHRLHAAGRPRVDRRGLLLGGGRGGRDDGRRRRAEHVAPLYCGVAQRGEERLCALRLPLGQRHRRRAGDGRRGVGCGAAQPLLRGRARRRVGAGGRAPAGARRRRGARTSARLAALAGRAAAGSTVRVTGTIAASAARLRRGALRGAGAIRRSVAGAGSRAALGPGRRRHGTGARGGDRRCRGHRRAPLHHGVRHGRRRRRLRAHVPVRELAHVDLALVVLGLRRLDRGEVPRGRRHGRGQGHAARGEPHEPRARGPPLPSGLHPGALAARDTGRRGLGFLLGGLVRHGDLAARAGDGRRPAFLLHHVRELVREEAIPRLAVGPEPARAEGDVLADRERLGVVPLVERRRLAVGVDADALERLLERLLHAPACVGRERPAPVEPSPRRRRRGPLAPREPCGRHRRRGGRDGRLLRVGLRDALRLRRRCSRGHGSHACPSSSGKETRNAAARRGGTPRRSSGIRAPLGGISTVATGERRRLNQYQNASRRAPVVSST